MVDPSLLGVQLPNASTEVFPQPLPSQQTADSTRFQDLLSGIGGGGQNSVDAPSMRDQPVLQRVDKGEPVDNASGFKDALIEKISGMDNSYHSIMDQLKNRPDLASYMGKGDGDQVMRTYPNVSSAGGDNAESSMRNMLDEMQKGNAAMLNYQRDMSSWAMNFQMWSSGVELASSVVSQISKGFQTLFRASG